MLLVNEFPAFSFKSSHESTITEISSIIYDFALIYLTSNFHCNISCRFLTLCVVKLFNFPKLFHRISSAVKLKSGHSRILFLFQKSPTERNFSANVRDFKNPLFPGWVYINSMWMKSLAKKNNTYTFPSLERYVAF